MTSCAVPSFTSALYIDRGHGVFDDPPFLDEAGQPTVKLARLRTPGNADAVVWSVFRTLMRLDAGRWLPALLAAMGSGGPLLTPGPSPLPALGEEKGGTDQVEVEFWRTVAPSTERLRWLLDHLDHPRVRGSRGALRQPERLELVRREVDVWRGRVAAGDPGPGAGVLEDPVELHAAVRAPGLLVAVEASMGAPLPVQTEWDTARDRIGRALDGLLDLADGEGVPEVAFLFIAPAVEKPRQPLRYDAVLPRYQDARERATLLPHRFASELARLEGRIVWLTWSHVLQAAAGACTSDDDKALVRGLRDWLFWQERRAGLR